jgi:O-antigen ligase
MRKLIDRAVRSNLPSTSFPGATLAALIPVFPIYYILLILPFIPSDAGERLENMLFWPVAVVLVLILIFRNRERIDPNFLRSLPIMSLIAYLLFAAASVTWAYSPDYAFSRLVVQVLLVIIVAAPYALPITTEYTLPGTHLCYVIALAISAVFVLTTPPSPIGHPGYFTHKQELGLLSAVGVILAAHELLHGGWRRILALVSMGLGIWLIFASESKSALVYALVALLCSWLILLLCKKTRLTPAYIVAAVVVASMCVSNPIERLGYRLYGDATLTGRTQIWGFIDYQISRKPWFGWGFHSYYFVPNSPNNEAPGYIRDMPSSHSGFLELKLETGRIGYWIFLVFIYSSLHLLERVRRKAPVRAWCYLSIELFAILINLTDSNWVELDAFWTVFLFVAVEAAYLSLPGKVPGPKQVPVRVGKRQQFVRTRPSASRGPLQSARKFASEISGEKIPGANELESFDR